MREEGPAVKVQERKKTRPPAKEEPEREGKSDFKDRFWMRVKMGDPDSCWEWQGYRTRDGYGALYFGGKKVIASRFAWIMTFGEIPKGMCVLHRCDNPACVNPRHLFLGTHRDNMRDAVLKLRKSGPHNGKTKLTWPQVDAIRLLFKMGWSTRKVARLFGVDHKTIWQIRAGETWKEPAEVMSAGVSGALDPGAFPAGISGAQEGGIFEAMGPGEAAGAGAQIPRTPRRGEVEESFEAAPLGAGTAIKGEAEESFLKSPGVKDGAFPGHGKEEFNLKSKGVWFVTERVETPALSLEFPVGFFRSRDAALEFVRGKEKSYRMRFIQSDLGEDTPSGDPEEADYCQAGEPSTGSLGEAQGNLKTVPEGAPCSGDPEGVPKKTEGLFLGHRREEF